MSVKKKTTKKILHSSKKKRGTDFVALQKAINEAHKAIGHKMTLEALDKARDLLWGTG